MGKWTDRTELLLGKENLQRLQNAHVLVAGLGGVGGYAAEHLCRAGIGKMTIVDGDAVSDTNRNRQLLALTSTRGRRKVQLMAQRLKDINPDIEIIATDEYLKNRRIDDICAVGYDYVVDAIDTLSPKVFLVYECMKQNLPVVSSMGAGGKTNPGLVQVADIADSHSCKLALYMRKRLHKLGVRTGFKVVFSPEPIPAEAMIKTENLENKKTIVGTLSYMPAVFGALCASVVIRDIISISGKN
jgi:tRNA A37 threonylcarbamoyladenosine dehydratase